jgi:phosphoenolpyruvate-protein phosphotransferase (PTS system enzyme I)
MDYFRLRGTGVSPGIAVGEVKLSERVVFTERKDLIDSNQVDAEIKRLNSAVDRTGRQIEELRDQIKTKLGAEHSFIFEAHLLILKDKSLMTNLRKIIRGEKCRSEWAISQVNKEYTRIFESISDEYFRQRKYDLTDVLSKLYMNLEDKIFDQHDDEKEKVLVAHDLLPSEAAHRLTKGNIIAVALDMGGTTSHTAILARSLNIPAVMGLSHITQKVKNGDLLIVDGSDGGVIINPPLAIRREFFSKQEKYEDYRKELQKTASLESKTLDQVHFVPLANIELPDEVKMALSLGAEGIGLFRTEFIFFQSQDLPTEEDHFKAYSQIAGRASPFPVYIRTMDIGGEKNLPQMKIEKEPNPALGLRAIRFSLKERQIFKTQIRAILRASVRKNVRILIPMITGIEEVEEVKLIMEEVKQELRAGKVKFDENIQLGVMIEVPAAAAITDKLIKEVDYVSVGTNDLIQYYLAVDRTNELVSYMFNPLHPSVLRLLRFIISSAQEAGKEVTLCGEMAADPLSAIVLLGLGLRQFSMNPIFIPKVKKALRSVKVQTAEELVEEVMALRTAQEIEERLIEKILVKHPQALLTSDVT